MPALLTHGRFPLTLCKAAAVNRTGLSAASVVLTQQAQPEEIAGHSHFSSAYPPMSIAVSPHVYWLYTDFMQPLIMLLSLHPSPIDAPAAKKSDLSAITRGHVVLVEYLEEHPAMLGQPGMGLQLTTYYRKVGTAKCCGMVGWGWIAKDGMGLQLIKRISSATAEGGGRDCLYRDAIKESCSASCTPYNAQQNPGQGLLVWECPIAESDA
eukprot:1158773-Pelagomonas_calceolata.AAC.2